MKIVIFPVVCAVLLVFLGKSFNPNIEAVGYIIGSGVGLGIGVLINKLVFKEKAAEKSEKDSVAK